MDIMIQTNFWGIEKMAKINTEAAEDVRHEKFMVCNALFHVNFTILDSYYIILILCFCLQDIKFQPSQVFTLQTLLVAFR